MSDGTSGNATTTTSVAERRSLKDVAQEWLLGQPAIVILLLGVICGGAYGLRWAAQMAREEIPKHLQQIQAGYENLEKSHREERAEARASNAEMIRLITGHKVSSARTPHESDSEQN